MMFLKREAEGYLLVDHRDSPGITPEEAAKAGRGTLAVGKGQRLECATYMCHVCEAHVVINPKRTRERHYCGVHDAYSCDRCANIMRSAGRCRSFKEVIDDFLRTASVNVF
jgi:hypothetical protein